MSMHERDAVHWLQLTYKVPSEPSQKRVWVWRRLQNLGAYALQNSVYLLPRSEDVEKHFRQLAQEICEMGGEASTFSVVALDIADERRIMHTLLGARNNEYNAVATVCGRFLAGALVEVQNWNAQANTDFAEVLEKVHVLFRTAKRHDMLGALTASRRAAAAEALAICEQVFRVLLDKDYAKARRLLEMHSDLLHRGGEADSSIMSVPLLDGHEELKEDTQDDGEIV
jgi:hypothetical protein